MKSETHPGLSSNNAVPSAGGAPLTILVTDDQAANIQIVGNMLGKLGYEIIPASDGPTALRVVQGFDPTVILSDIGMPGMDGYQLLSDFHYQPYAA